MLRQPRLRRAVTPALPLAMLRLLVVLAAALCAFPAPGVLAWSSASDTGLPECVWQLRSTRPGSVTERVVLCSCALLVFRHVQKTGGSTLRNFFRKQEATGDWEFYRCVALSFSSCALRH